MSDQLVCANGHTNPDGWAVCGVCGAFPSPGQSSAVVNRVATAVPLAVDLEAEAGRFNAYFQLFAVLTALGALGIGYVASKETTCSAFGTFIDCETTVDGATFAIVAASTFIAGMLLVLPLRGIAILLRGMARLPRSNDEPSA